MIDYHRNENYPARFKVSKKKVACAYATLQANKVSVHSGSGTLLLPLLNTLEGRKIPYRLTAVPNRNYMIQLLDRETLEPLVK